MVVVVVVAAGDVVPVLEVVVEATAETQQSPAAF
jgi:hypothetical protein